MGNLRRDMMSDHPCPVTRNQPIAPIGLRRAASDSKGAAGARADDWSGRGAGRLTLFDDPCARLDDRAKTAPLEPSTSVYTQGARGASVHREPDSPSGRV